MTRTINEIMGSISLQPGLANLNNVADHSDGLAAGLGIENQAAVTVVAIRPEDFVVLPAEEQQALIDAGFDLRSFVNTTSGMAPPGSAGLTMPPRIYVVRWEDDAGVVQYAPLGNVMEERCNLAAYACAQLNNIVAGSQPMAESAPTLYEKMQIGRMRYTETEEVEVEGKIEKHLVAYSLIPAENFSMNDMVALYNQGWKVKSFTIDGQQANYYYKVLTSTVISIE